MTKEDLFKLADKVQISLEAFDKESLLKEFNEMQVFIERIQSLGDITNSVSPFEHPLISHVSLRKDLVQDSYDPQIILKNAPEQENNSIVVPKVL